MSIRNNYKCYLNMWLLTVPVGRQEAQHAEVIARVGVQELRYTDRVLKRLRHFCVSLYKQMTYKRTTMRIGGLEDKDNFEQLTLTFSISFDMVFTCLARSNIVCLNENGIAWFLFYSTGTIMLISFQSVYYFMLSL